MIAKICGILPMVHDFKRANHPKSAMDELDHLNHFRSFCLTVVCAIAVLSLAGCKGHTHITGTVKNKWGGPIYLATITLSQGVDKQQVKTTQEGTFDIALDHPLFKTDLKLTATSDIYKTVEKSFSARDRLKTVNLIMEERPEPTLAEVRKAWLKGITLKDARELAELMCRQLPNASAFPLKSFMSGDDVHDTLVALNGVAQPCLVEHLTDSAWMPDSRSEPLAYFHAGDAALWILSDAGLDWDIVVPLLNQKEWSGVGVYAYFGWINTGNHRKAVQKVVKKWLQEHPDCCGTEADFANTPDSASGSKISPQRFTELQLAWKQLKPGMNEQVVRKLLGPADDIADPETMDGVADLNRFEKSAEFYMVENRSGKDGKFDCRRRNFLRDRYVIVFYGENRKFIRAFSNVPELPPIFPKSEKFWSSMIEASMAEWQQEQEQSNH
jgi:hypothetical protein